MNVDQCDVLSSGILNGWCNQWNALGNYLNDNLKMNPDTKQLILIYYSIKIIINNIMNVYSKIEGNVFEI